MILKVLKAIVAFALARPQNNTQSIGYVAGNGGWDLEDADHLRKN